jgi:Family of unknown function (DUF5703)
MRTFTAAPKVRDYQFREISLPRGLTIRQAHQLIVEQAEIGRWELARVRRYADGRRLVTLRRRIIRQESTLGLVDPDF